jgi:hypothetical protein
MYFLRRLRFQMSYQGIQNTPKGCLRILMQKSILKRLITGFLFFTAVASVSGQNRQGTGAASLADLVGSELAGTLLTETSITEIQYRNPKPILSPQHSFTRSLIDSAQAVLEPSIFVESLTRFEKPAGAVDGAWIEAERNNLYNEALALSTLAGIEYFSASRNKMRVFYETSTVIDGPESKRPLPDPSYQVPPAELQIYAQQKDLTFGDNIYQYRYFVQKDALVFVQENLSSLTVGPIPVVGKNKLRSIVAVLDAGDSLMIYIASMAKAASFPGMNERAGRSFSNRAEALLSWFFIRVDEAFKKAKNTVSS